MKYKNKIINGGFLIRYELFFDGSYHEYSFIFRSVAQIIYDVMVNHTHVYTPLKAFFFELIVFRFRNFMQTVCMKEKKIIIRNDRKLK